MVHEYVDVTEGQFPDAGGRMTVMGQVNDLWTCHAHLVEPATRVDASSAGFESNHRSTRGF